MQNSNIIYTYKYVCELYVLSVICLIFYLIIF